MLHGFLNIDKPHGITSHDVVAKVRRAAKQRRVGHGGTLDPLATGVLPVALGGATRLVEYLVEDRKAYHATVRLGVTTTTDDAEGPVVDERPVPVLDRAALAHTLAAFVGTIAQIPPIYSAVHVDGQRAYDLARRGDNVTLAPRTVVIHQITIAAWESPMLTLDVVCGKGTYLRALARDLGAALGCGAHLAALRRTAVGPLRIEHAVPLALLLDAPDLVAQQMLPPAAAVAAWPRIDVDALGSKRIRNGLPIAGDAPGDLARVHDDAGALLALARRRSDQWCPFKVFDWS